MTPTSCGPIDPRDPAHHDRPLWVVYGHECAPSAMCVKLLAYDRIHRPLPAGHAGAVVCIWGYSVYDGRPGFRTLGVELGSWAERSTLGPLFYTTMDDALGELRRLLTPERIDSARPVRGTPA